MLESMCSSNNIGHAILLNALAPKVFHYSASLFSVMNLTLSKHFFYFVCHLKKIVGTHCSFKILMSVLACIFCICNEVYIGYL
jgi:hypothetical protein